MDARERQREEEKEGKEQGLSQEGDKPPYCSNAGAKEKDVNDTVKVKKTLHRNVYVAGFSF